jgi:hypothetical protein
MEWSHSDTIGLAKASCALCQGEGFRPTVRKAPNSPCNCVTREIFRSCFNRFRSCVLKEKRLSQATLQISGGRNPRRTWGRRDEEYVADFSLISKRTLDEFEYKIFKFHYLLGADWKLCCRQLNLDRGAFFHALYRIQQKLGRVFREVEPFALFPLDEYFGGTVRKIDATSNLRVMPARPNGRAGLVAPLRKIA